jgi:hypothetical protein
MSVCKLEVSGSNLKTGTYVLSDQTCQNNPVDHNMNFHHLEKLTEDNRTEHFQEIITPESEYFAVRSTSTNKMHNHI